MASVLRFSRQSVFDGDIVILARAADDCASEIFGIVAVNCVHFHQSMANWQIGLNSVACEVLLPLPGCATSSSVHSCARLEFWSEVGAGTEVELAVPASVAYGKSRDARGFRLLHKRTKTHAH